MIDGSYIIGSTISAIVTKVAHIDEYYVIVLRDTIAVGMITVSYSIGIVIYTCHMIIEIMGFTMQWHTPSSFFKAQIVDNPEWFIV